MLLLVPLLRRDRVARFWATGMLLSVIPACTAFPADRMLVWVGIGALAVVAQFLTWKMGAASEKEVRGGRALPARALVWFLVAVHLVAAPLALPARAAWFAGPPGLLDQVRPTKPLDASVADQDLIIVNPP